jgi:hypothetical protein
MRPQAAIFLIAVCARIYWAIGRFTTYKSPFLAQNVSKTTSNHPSCRFHFNARFGAKLQTVLQHSKAKQQHIALKWKWKWNHSRECGNPVPTPGLRKGW